MEPLILPDGHHSRVTGSPVSFTTPCQAYPPATGATLVRRTAIVLSSDIGMTSSGCGAFGPASCMPLVSAYSATLGGGSSIMRILTTVFDSIAPCIIVLCLALIAGGLTIGANGRFHVASSFVNLTPALVAAAMTPFIL